MGRTVPQDDPSTRGEGPYPSYAQPLGSVPGFVARCCHGTGGPKEKER